MQVLSILAIVFGTCLALFGGGCAVVFISNSSLEKYFELLGDREYGGIGWMLSVLPFIAGVILIGIGWLGFKRQR